MPLTGKGEQRIVLLSSASDLDNSVAPAARRRGEVRTGLQNWRSSPQGKAKMAKGEEEEKKPMRPASAPSPLPRKRGALPVMSPRAAQKQTGESEGGIKRKETKPEQRSWRASRAGGELVREPGPRSGTRKGPPQGGEGDQSVGR